MKTVETQEWEAFLQKMKGLNTSSTKTRGPKRIKVRDKKARPEEMLTPEQYRRHYSTMAVTLEGGSLYYPSASDPGYAYAKRMSQVILRNSRRGADEPRAIIFSQNHGGSDVFGVRYAKAEDIEVPETRSNQEDINALLAAHAEQAEEQKLDRFLHQLQLVLGTLVGSVSIDKQVTGYYSGSQLTTNDYIITVREKR